MKQTPQILQIKADSLDGALYDARDLLVYGGIVPQQRAGTVIVEERDSANK